MLLPALDTSGGCFSACTVAPAEMALLLGLLSHSNFPLFLSPIFYLIFFSVLLCCFFFATALCFNKVFITRAVLCNVLSTALQASPSYFNSAPLRFHLLSRQWTAVSCLSFPSLSFPFSAHISQIIRLVSPARWVLRQWRRQFSILGILTRLAVACLATWSVGHLWLTNIKPPARIYTILKS